MLQRLPCVTFTLRYHLYNCQMVVVINIMACIHCILVSLIVFRINSFSWIPLHRQVRWSVPWPQKHEDKVKPTPPSWKGEDVSLRPTCLRVAETIAWKRVQWLQVPRAGLSLLSQSQPSRTPQIPNFMFLNGMATPSFSETRQKHENKGTIRCAAVISNGVSFNASNMSLKFQPAS